MANIKRTRDSRGMRPKKGEKRPKTPGPSARKKAYRAHCKNQAAAGLVNHAATGVWTPGPGPATKDSHKNSTSGARGERADV